MWGAGSWRGVAGVGEDEIDVVAGGGEDEIDVVTGEGEPQAGWKVGNFLGFHFCLGSQRRKFSRFSFLATTEV